MSVTFHAVKFREKLNTIARDGGEAAVFRFLDRYFDRENDMARLTAAIKIVESIISGAKALRESFCQPRLIEFDVEGVRIRFLVRVVEWRAEGASYVSTPLDAVALRQLPGAKAETVHGLLKERVQEVVFGSTSKLAPRALR